MSVKTIVLTTSLKTLTTSILKVEKHPKFGIQLADPASVSMYNSIHHYPTLYSDMN